MSSSATQRVTLETLEHSTTQMPLLGYTIAWRISGGMIERSAFVEALTTTGLDTFLPSVPSKRVALRRAIEEWVRMRSRLGTGPKMASASEDTGRGDDDDTSIRALLRPVRQRPKSRYHAYALVSEIAKLATLGLSYGTDIRILLNKTTDELIVMTDAEGLPAVQLDAAQAESNQIAHELGPIWTEQRTRHPAGDVARLVKKLVTACHAVALRPGGGYYFVPLAERDRLQKIRAMLTALDPAGQHMFMLVVGVPDRVATKHEMSRAAFHGLMDEIRTLEQDFATIVAGGTTKPETLEARLDTYRSMKLRIQGFSEALGMQQADLLAALDTLQATCRSTLRG